MNDPWTGLRHKVSRRFYGGVGGLVLVAVTTFGTILWLVTGIMARDSIADAADLQIADIQRIGSLVAASDQLDGAASRRHREELRRTLNAARHRHAWLAGEVRGSWRTRSERRALGPIYDAGTPTLRDSLSLFFEDVARFADAPPGEAPPARAQELVIAAAGPLGRSQELVRQVVQERHRSATRSALTIIAGLIAVQALGIALVALFAFRPLCQRLQFAYEALDRARQNALAAQKNADDADAAKGHFLQAASHELKTPLNAIVGMTEAVKERGVPEIQPELVQIQSAGENLERIMNNIIDAHQMGIGKIVLSEQNFDLLDALRVPVESARNEARSKGLDFEIDHDIADDLTVLGDARRIEQLLRNLLDNAIKFTGSGGIKFTARYSAEQELAMTVSDTGIGIDHDRLGEIFDRFSAKGSMLSRSGGLGIGLALAKAIAEAMGGEIKVTSSPGAGSSFTVTVPLRKVAAKSPPKTTNAPSVDGSPNDSSTSRPGASVPAAALRVLVVDDNLANRMVAEAMIAPLGAQIVSASDGREAVSRSRDAGFDLIFMDISMPVMDGMEATNLIRTRPGPNARTPIVALTAHAGPAEWASMRAVGFDDLLNKPVRKDAISKCITRWAGARHRVDAA